VRYNTIIVGAGPSGSTAAYYLAQKKKSTLLLEAKKLPRFKACGGGVSQNLVDSLPVGVDVSSAIRGTTNSVRFYDFELTNPVDVRLKDPILMTDRSQFDMLLVQAAVDKGAQLKEEVTVKYVFFDGNKYNVMTSAGRFEADHVIAADGVFSKLAQDMGLIEKPKVIFAVEAEVKGLNANPSATHWGRVNIDEGYAWVFPGEGCSSIGVLGMGKGDKLRAALDEWINLWGFKGEVGKIHGHPIPLIDYTRRLQLDRFFTVGDAAGLADSLTGEGIKFAIMSGRFAAEAILSGRPSSYSWKVRTNIYPYFAFGSVFRPIVWRWTDFIYKHGITNPFVQYVIKQAFDRV